MANASRDVLFDALVAATEDQLVTRSTMMAIANAATAYLAEQGYAVVATSGPEPIGDDLYAILADAKAIIGGLTTISHRRMSVWQRITAVLAREDGRRAAQGETK